MIDVESELVGSECELSIPYRGHRYGIVEADYGYELLVRLSNGKELSLCKDEIVFC